MKRLNMIAALAVVALFFAGRQVYRSQDTRVETADVTMCGSSGGIVTAGPDGKFMTALSGWGNLTYNITTKSDSAQFYFNQGLSLYYGYHFPEAVASFKEASRFDPASAMTYWGQALAMGPFYNTYSYRMPKEVPGIVETMVSKRSAANEKEKDLVDAMQKRYSKDLTNADRKNLDANYIAALKSLEKKYTDDSNIKALYIDAIMLQHKWDFWTHDGTPRPWTTEVVAMCEEVLKEESHPAILHYYIHLTEASRQPNRALAAADVLKDQLPAVPHMVHMATHMYQRNGLYTKGVSVNEDAHEANNNLYRISPSLGLGKDKTIHYYAVQSFCAMTAGLYEKGVPIYDRARDRQVAMDPDFNKETYAQFVYMMPMMARVRLGKWDEVLAQAKPDGNWKYAVALDNFARGVAYVRKNDLKSAKQCLNNLNEAMKDPAMSVRYMPFNSPLQSCKVAVGILNGEILFAEGKMTGSVAEFEHAAVEEDKLVYREPQDWLIPARQFLGARLLKMNKAADAEKVYAEDLIMNPGNGWSLLGMHQSIRAQGDVRATEYEKRYKEAFAEADVVVTASVF